jgi:glycosyltransferase involved in cell wall biosynthesis
MRPPAGRSQLRLLRARAVRRLARTVRPDVVIERYHNFGGEGALAAKATGARFALEVNAPVIDYPGSPKAALDRALIAQPMRRWRDWQVSQADLIVTPSAKILPDGVPADRVLEIEWGADTTRFHPGATGAVPWPRDPSTIVAVFAGAFRTWHGAIQLVEAIKRLHALGHTQYQAVLIGEGPERGAAEQAARGVRGITFAGRVAHTDMPPALAAADIGVAPFDVGRHPPLALAFYWSPLKVFEYMASGLPVVAPGLPRLRGLVEHGVEGALYEPATPAALAEAMATLADPAVRSRMGQAARDRAVRDYGWDAHCRALDAALRARI